MLQTQYNIVAVLPQYNISTVQKTTCVSLTNTMAGSGTGYGMFSLSLQLSYIDCAGTFSARLYQCVYHGNLDKTHMTKCRVSNYTDNFVNLKISHSRCDNAKF